MTKWKKISIDSEASDEEWARFYKEVEALMLNEEEGDSRRPIRLYESILRERQDQS